MLKIKDFIPLKELEKFNFTYKEGHWRYKDSLLRFEICIDDYKTILIADPKRQTNWCCIPAVLYDLITAGLVEKVPYNGKRLVETRGA